MGICRRTLSDRPGKGCGHYFFSSEDGGRRATDFRYYVGGAIHHRSTERAYPTIYRPDSVFQLLHLYDTPLQFEWAIPSLLQQSRDKYLYQLTIKEKKVFALMLQDDNNATIAAKMNITVETVKTHKKNIRGKLGRRQIGLLLSSLTNI